MTINEQGHRILEIAHGWAADDGGRAELMFSLAHLWRMSANKASAPYVMVCYNGEDQRENFPGGAITGRVDRHWIVALRRDRQLNQNPGDSLSESRQNARPLYDLVDEMRDLCRSILFSPQNEERPVDFKSVRPMVDPFGVPHDGYLVEFSVGTQLGLVVESTDEMLVPA